MQPRGFLCFAATHKRIAGLLCIMLASLKLFTSPSCKSILNYHIRVLYSSESIRKVLESLKQRLFNMNTETKSGVKREHEVETEEINSEPNPKTIKSNLSETRLGELKHGKNRPIPNQILKKLTDDDIKLIETVTTSCTDLEKIKAAISLRMKHRLSTRLPDDPDDSTYYIEDGLRRVYGYNYLYQSYTKRRWIGRKLRDVIKQEFRDIADEHLERRFNQQRILVNGEPVNYEYVLRDNNFVSNMTHRHELAVLAAPIKFIYRDKSTLVIDKPPSIPIHPCGRYRHNSVCGILAKEYNIRDVKVVHRLDRLVSGVLLMALNSQRANELEQLIKNRDVQKEYVCRVVGEFPLGKPEDDYEVVVNQPLETIPGKIGITVAIPEGKESSTKFKRLNYNGKTSAVLCRPQTGRMHQIRVHLQYLGHPIVNDSLYNCAAFGSERGKNGNYGKSIKQLSLDIISMHRADVWLRNDDMDELSTEEGEEKAVTNGRSGQDEKVVKFKSEEERKETMAALEHFFTNESWKDLEQKWKFDPARAIKNPTCRDCMDKYHDPPLRNLFLYLHALKYSGPGWCYESDLPVWAHDSWQY